MVDKTTYNNEVLTEGDLNLNKDKKIYKKNMFEISRPLLRLDDIDKEDHKHAL